MLHGNVLIEDITVVFHSFGFQKTQKGMFISAIYTSNIQLNFSSIL